MKRLFVSTALLAATAFVFAQKAPPASPPEQATVTLAGHAVTIDYNSPAVKGREGQIFNKGGLIQRTHKEYPIWRAGANGATTLTTEADLKIGNLDVPAGKYTLFVDISDPDNWVLVVNKKTGEWGLAYDASQDLGKTPMRMSKPAEMMEHLKYTLTSTSNTKGTLSLAWESHEASVPIEAK
ncbi:MAG TPA: DUF2911 domain-containing protein [Terracidiphilus sp.]|jgi:hypothetical protein|nr:DUF2911 domain-containing protein [Terracidiphilus sp.]